MRTTTCFVCQASKVSCNLVNFSDGTQVKDTSKYGFRLEIERHYVCFDCLYNVEELPSDVTFIYEDRIYNLNSSYFVSVRSGNFYRFYITDARNDAEYATTFFQGTSRECHRFYSFLLTILSCLEFPTNVIADESIYTFVNADGAENYQGCYDTWQKFSTLGIEYTMMPSASDAVAAYAGKLGREYAEQYGHKHAQHLHTHIEDVLEGLGNNVCVYNTRDFHHAFQTAFDARLSITERLDDCYEYIAASWLLNGGDVLVLIHVRSFYPSRLDVFRLHGEAGCIVESNNIERINAFLNPMIEERGIAFCGASSSF